MSEEMKMPNPNPNGAKPMKSEEDTAMDMMGYNKNSFGGFDRTKGELDKRINYKGNQLGARVFPNELSNEAKKIYGDKFLKKGLPSHAVDGVDDRYWNDWGKADQRQDEIERYKASQNGNQRSEEDNVMKMMGYPEEKEKPNKYDIPYSSKSADVPAYLTVKMKDGGVTYYELSEGETVNDALSRMEEEAGDLIDGVYDNVTNWNSGPSIWRK